MDLVHLYKNDYSQEMSKMFKPKVVGKYEIVKVVVPKGTEQQHYMKGVGICRSVLETDFPTVQLRELDGRLWMSDVPMEQETYVRALEEARGDVLECGLGIGMFTHFASKKDEVKTITVIEKERDVIKLVYSKIKNPKTSYVISDMLDYLIMTKERYDMIHVDIWADITNYKKMLPISEVARRKLKPNGTVVCWLDESLRKILKEAKKGARTSSRSGVDMPPCLRCGKTFRNDFGGFCMDCADVLGISELFLKSPPKGVKN